MRADDEAVLTAWNKGGRRDALHSVDRAKSGVGTQIGAASDDVVVVATIGGPVAAVPTAPGSIGTDRKGTTDVGAHRQEVLDVSHSICAERHVGDVGRAVLARSGSPAMIEPLARFRMRSSSGDMAYTVRVLRKSMGSGAPTLAKCRMLGMSN